MIENVDINLTESELDSFYNGYFGYYKTLNKQLQSFFVGRCQQFISGKTIIGEDGFKPNNKVKAIIAGSAVQLTLGLENWDLKYFETIIIHPADFDNKPSGLKFKGETNLEGYMRLSWKSFISGYLITTDNINLGLHEFTHALRFNPIRGLDQDYFIEHYFNAWLAAANEPFSDIKQNKESIFRKYGGTNINEFLSVCVEHYFESPEEIKQHYPYFYYAIAILLNQQNVNGKTEINVRKKLFSEKNLLLKLTEVTEIKSKWNKTSSFKMAIAVIIPLIYTVIVTGFMSGATIFLLSLLFFFYLRFDYLFIKTQIFQNKFILEKGFLLFRGRKNIVINLSQLISLRVYGNTNNDSECTFIYYDLTNNYFYTEDIPSGNTLSNKFLSALIYNKIAVFNS